MKIPLCLPALLLVLLLMAPTRAATLFYIRPYQDRTQNPFWQGVLNDTMYLEDFEDRQLNTPYVTGFGGAIYQTKSTPNVVGDGNGSSLGFTWTSLATGAGEGDIRFDFNPNTKGELPKYAGAALFGGLFAESEITYYEKILVYDAGGMEITAGNWRLEIPVIAPGALSTSVHRFVGIYYEGGISRISFPGTTTIDHLTYGYAIPEPSSGALLLGALGAALNRRRRGRA
ncbi:MAG: PEP-CTERM sorting domain-containing protein [Verrucomicrobiota bacterium]